MAAKKAKEPLLSFASLRELTFFLTLLDKFLGLKLGRVATLLEPIRSCGMETYSWHGCGEDVRAVSFVSTTRETKRKLPTQETGLVIHLCDQQGQGLEIVGKTSFLHSQKLSAAFKAFHQETSDFEASFRFQRLLISVHSAVLAYMEKYSDAQSFAERFYASLKKEIEGENELPF